MLHWSKHPRSKKNKRLAASRRLPRTCVWLGLIGALLPVMTGCESDESPLPAWDPQKQMTLKVLDSDKASFMEFYGALFQVKYPQIRVEVVEVNDTYHNTVNEETVKAAIQRGNPDVLRLSTGLYGLFAEEGRLYNLETIVRADSYKLDAFAKPVVDELRAKGGGSLAGLAPGFTSNGLYYNRSLFDQYGVPYPSDRMTWESMLQLAHRFPSSDGRAGFGVLDESPLRLFQTMLAAHHVSPLTGDGKRVAVQTSSWSKLLTLAANSFQTGVIDRARERSGPEDALQVWRRDPFLNGTSAMIIRPYLYVHTIPEAQQALQQTFEWDVVTPPSDAKQPTAMYQIPDVFAISAESTQLRPAWELIKFIHSEDMARSRIVVYPDQIPVRTGMAANPAGRHLEAFWTIPVEGNSGIAAFDQSFWKIAERPVEAALFGTQSVKETLTQLQEEGEIVLQELQAKEQLAEQMKQQQE